MLVVAASLQRRRALWTSRVRGWFVQAEAQFATKGVTVSLTKYFYVIQALRQRTINRIPDLLILPVEDPYHALKDKLVEMYNLLDYQRAELLMALPFVLPSELMDCMKALMPPEEQARPSILFLHAFLSACPRTSTSAFNVVVLTFYSAVQDFQCVSRNSDRVS